VGVSWAGTASACCRDWLRLTSMPPGIEGVGAGGVSAANKISNASTTAWPATEKARGSLILSKASTPPAIARQHENILVGGLRSDSALSAERVVSRSSPQAFAARIGVPSGRPRPQLFPGVAQIAHRIVLPNLQ